MATIRTSLRGALLPITDFERVCKEEGEPVTIGAYKRSEAEVLVPCEFNIPTGKPPRIPHVFVWRTKITKDNYDKIKFALDFLRLRPSHPVFLDSLFGFLPERDTEGDAVIVTEKCEPLRKVNDIIAHGLYRMVEWLHLSGVVHQGLQKDCVFVTGTFPKVFVAPISFIDVETDEEGRRDPKVLSDRIEEDMNNLKTIISEEKFKDQRDEKEPPTVSELRPFYLDLKRFRNLHCVVDAERRAIVANEMRAAECGDLKTLLAQTEKLMAWHEVISAQLPDNEPGIIAFLKAKERRVGVKLVTLKLSSNDIYETLGTKSRGTFSFDDVESTITLEFDEDITPKAFLIRTGEFRDMLLRNIKIVCEKDRKDGQTQNVVLFEGEDRRLSLTNTIVYLGTKEQVTGRKFILSRMKQIEGVDGLKVIRGLDIATADHEYGYINDMVEVIRNPHVIPVWASSNRSSDDFYISQGQCIVQTLGNVQGLQEWIEVAFPRHLVVPRSFSIAFCEKCEKSSSGDGDWELLATIGDASWHPVCHGGFLKEKKEYELNESGAVNKFRVVSLKPGVPLELSHFEVYGDLFYAAGNVDNKEGR